MYDFSLQSDLYIFLPTIALNSIFFQFCHVGRLSHEVGWKYQAVVRTLESKRKVKAVLAIRKRDKLKKLTKAASEKVTKQVQPFTATINSYGYN